MGKGACVYFFGSIYYNCIIILLNVTVFVWHVFCTINSPVYVYWKQVKKIYSCC